jgi:hypothetical protein
LHHIIGHGMRVKQRQKLYSSLRAIKFAHFVAPP